jgi:hypothetical protein
MWMAKQTAVSIKLDKQRKLKYTFNAFCELEDVLGRPISEIKDGFKLKDLRALLWAGLLHESPDLTLEDAGELMDKASSLEEVAEAVVKAMEKSVVKSREDGELGK